MYVCHYGALVHLYGFRRTLEDAVKTRVCDLTCYASLNFAFPVAEVQFHFRTILDPLILLDSSISSSNFLQYNTIQYNFVDLRRRNSPFVRLRDRGCMRPVDSSIPTCIVIVLVCNTKCTTGSRIDVDDYRRLGAKRTMAVRCYATLRVIADGTNTV